MLVILSFVNSWKMVAEISKNYRFRCRCGKYPKRTVYSTNYNSMNLPDGGPLFGGNFFAVSSWIWSLLHLGPGKIIKTNQTQINPTIYITWTNQIKINCWHQDVCWQRLFILQNHIFNSKTPSLDVWRTHYDSTNLNYCNAKPSDVIQGINIGTMESNVAINRSNRWSLHINQ
jgi:hypothetical protein